MYFIREVLLGNPSEANEGEGEKVIFLGNGSIKHRLMRKIHPAFTAVLNNTKSLHYERTLERPGAAIGGKTLSKYHINWKGGNCYYCSLKINVCTEDIESGIVTCKFCKADYFIVRIAKFVPVTNLEIKPFPN